MTTFQPSQDWRTRQSGGDVDWPVIITAMIIFAVLACGITAYLAPQTFSGSFDRCVAQRAETFKAKTDFPVIPAVTQCGVLRDAGALG